MECPASLRAKSYFIESDDFTRSREIIGCGSFGVVYEGTYAGQKRAMKYIHRHLLLQSTSATRFKMDEFDRECELTRRLSSPHIVHFVGVSFHRNVPVLITELLECSLTDVLRCSHCSVPYHRDIDLALGIARGLNFLHGQRPPVVHRDLSSNNILLATDYTVKIADLGLSKVMDTNNCTPMPGTPYYMPPEVKVPVSYKIPMALSTAIDLYSYAVLLIQLETREELKPAEKMEKVLLEGFEMDGERGEGDDEKNGEGDGNSDEGASRTAEPSEEDSRRCHRVIVRSEEERWETQTKLMDSEGVLHKIVRCYLEDEPRARRRTQLSQVITWLEDETRDLKYTEDFRSNAQTPLEHRSANHAALRGASLSSSTSLELSKGMKKKKKKVRDGAGDDSGFYSQDSNRPSGDLVLSTDDDWQLVEGSVPSDDSGRGLFSRVGYQLTRFSGALGLTTVGEDDDEYKQRVFGSM